MLRVPELLAGQLLMLWPEDELEYVLNEDGSRVQSGPSVIKGKADEQNRRN